MNWKVVTFLSVATVCLTTLILYSKFKEAENKKKIAVENIYPAKPETKTVFKDRIKYKPDPKTELENQRLKTELKATQDNYQKLLAMYRQSLKILDEYKKFFASYNLCIANYDKKEFKHYGSDKTVKCHFWNNGSWIVKEAESFGEFVRQGLE